MKIEFRAASYYASDLTPEDRALDWGGWIKVRTGYRTGNIERAAAHSALAIGEAKRRIDAWLKMRHDAIAPSVASTSDIEIPAPAGLSYRPYQKAGVAFMRARRNSLNADVPRLGKTIQSMGVINTYGHCLKVLVVGPANAKSNWAREADRWLVHKGTIGYAEGNNCPTTDFLSINYEILGRHIRYLESVVWDVVIFDEAHYIKNPKSQRGKMCYGFKKEFKGLCGRLHTFWTTGTPIWRAPIDMWPMIERADPNGLGDKWFTFVMRYCAAKNNGFGYDVSGSSNMEELQFKMRKSFMIRREKKDVMKEIIPARETVLLPKDGLSKMIHKEKTLVQKNLETIFTLLGEQEQAKADEILAAFNELAASTNGPIAAVRRELALAKCPMVCDFLDELLLAEKKVVVWVYHRDMGIGIKERFPNASMVIGGLTTKQRDEQIARFQDDPDVELFIGNMDAAGSAISLSAADVDVFAELDYVPSKIDQCEERTWLVDKTNPCTHIKLVVEDSLEEKIAALLEIRQNVVKQAMSVSSLPGNGN